jgi:hypothetical protein
MHGDHHAILMPDGQVSDPACGLFDTIEEWTDRRREEHAQAAQARAKPQMTARTAISAIQPRGEWQKLSRSRRRDRCAASIL